MGRISYLRLHRSPVKKTETGLKQQELVVLLGKEKGAAEKKAEHKQSQKDPSPEPEST